MLEALWLYPLDGEFEVGLVRRYLDGRSDTVLDPLGSGRYLLVGTWSLASKLGHARSRVSPPHEFPYAAMIIVGSGQVALIVEFADEQELAAMYEVRDWLTARWPCRITDERGGDRTGWRDPRDLRPASPVEWAPDWWDELPSLGPRAVLPVEGVVDPGAVAWRVEWPDGASAEEFAELLERLDLESCVALVIGASEPWPDQDEDLAAAALGVLEEAVPVLAGLAPRLPALTGLALLDLIDYERADGTVPAAWRTPIDVTMVLRAFPRLEFLRVIGALRLSPLRHDRLRRLWVHSPEPWADAVAACDFPALNR
jgi:hypothetical protein